MVSLAAFIKSIAARAARLSKVSRVPVELIRSAALIGFILLIGMALLLSRELLLLVSPFIAKHAVGIATFFNVIFTMIIDVRPREFANVRGNALANAAGFSDSSEFVFGAVKLCLSRVSIDSRIILVEVVTVVLWIVVVPVRVINANTI